MSQQDKSNQNHNSNAHAILDYIERKPLHSLMIVSTVFILIPTLLVLSILIIFKIFGLKFQQNAISHEDASKLIPRLEINASSGWINSAVRVKAGQSIVISPAGRVQLALNHAFNSAQLVKPIVINNLEGYKLDDIENLKKRYPMPPLADTNVFYRSWTGPEGDTTSSDVFDDCKLQKHLGWGALLCLIVDSDDSDICKKDPFIVMKTAILSKSIVHHVSSKTTIYAEKDGYLCFIVNEAVMSEASDSDASVAFYKAIKKSMAQPTISDVIHKYDVSNIPLILFNDNLGSFSVSIEISD